jgi:hypothetical protein
MDVESQFGLGGDVATHRADPALPAHVLARTASYLPVSPKLFGICAELRADARWG